MKKKFLVTFLISLICFSVIFAGLGRYLSNRDSIAFTGDEDDDEVTEGAFKGKDEILFLLMGIDDQQGTGGVAKVKEKKIEGEDKHKPTGNRTDTMMLCKFNFKTGDISILSIPRDTRVRIRGRKNEAKINAAHSHGGPYLAIKTVKDFLNIDLEYYVTVDYLAVKGIVDAIRGVEIDVPRNMKYNDPTDKPPLKINIKEGPQVLDGDTSLDYLRFRSYPEGDLGRIQAQQLFMKEFIKQVLQSKNIIKLPKMAKTYFDYVDTNIPLGVVVKGVGNAKKIDMENIKMATIPGEGKRIGREDFLIYYKNDTEALVQEMFGDYLINQ